MQNGINAIFIPFILWGYDELSDGVGGKEAGRFYNR